MRFYLASPLSNSDLNALVAEAVTTLGHECFLPQRDAPQDSDPKLTFKANIQGIRNADCILVVGRNLGNDTAWELGFAKALGKPTALFHTGEDEVAHSCMLFQSVDHTIVLPSYRLTLPMVLAALAQLEPGRIPELQEAR